MKKAIRNSQKKKKSIDLLSGYQVLNLLEDGIALVDNDWKYVFLNDSSLTLNYHAREDIIGRTIWDVHPELLGSPFEELLRNAMNNNEQAESEQYYEPFDAWLLVKVFPTEEGLTLYYTNITERKKAQVQREFSDLIVQSSKDAIVRLDSDLKITSWNKGAEKMSGYSQAEVLGEPMDWRRPKDGREDEELIAKRILQGSQQETFFTERLRKDGGIDYLSMVLTPIKDTLGNVNGVSVIARNISNLKLVEKELQKSQRLYAFLSAINQCIVHTKAEPVLLQKACSIAEEVGNYRVAWVILLDENGDLSNDQMFGNADFIERYRAFPKIDYKSFPFSNSPSGRVLATGKYSVANDLREVEAYAEHHDELESQNLRSLISLPLFKDGELYAVFSLYSCKVNHFEEKEIKLLIEASADISHGIEIIEHEKLRLIAEERVLQDTVILNHSQELALIGSFEVDFIKNQVTWSDEMYRMFGYSPGQIEPTEELFLSHLHPEDSEKMKPILADFNTNFKDASYEFRIITVSGEIKYISAKSRFVFDENGSPIKVYGTNQDVTRRFQIEEKNKGTKLILDQSQQMAHVGSSEIDIETGTSIWSAEHYRILGYEPFEIEPSTELYMSHVHPDDLEAVSKSFSDDFSARKDNSREYRIITKTGEIKHISGQIKFEFDQNGIAKKMFGTTQDITKRVEFDIENKRNRLILDQSQQMAQIGSFEIDLDTGKRTWSDERYRMFGYSPGEIVPTDELYFSHIHPEDRDRMRANFEEFKKTFKDSSIEFRIITATGELKNMASKAKFEFDAKGKPTKIYGTTQDITIRVELDEKNKRNKIILDQSQQMSHVGSTEIDLETGASIWSAGQYRLLGYEPFEVEPSVELYLSHVHPDDAQEKIKLFHEVFTAREDSVANYRVVTKSGEVKYIEGQVKFEFDENGVAKKMYGTTQDITKRVEFDETNKRNKFILDQSQQMARIGSLEVNLETNKTVWSDEQYRIFGYVPDEVQPSIELYISHLHPDDKVEKTKLFYEIFAKYQDTTQKYKIITKSGEVKYIFGHLKFEFDEKGKPKKMLGTVQDVTKRVEVEKQLKYNEAFTRAVIDSLSSHVGVVDKNGFVVATNEPWNVFGKKHKATIFPRAEVGVNLFEQCELSADLYGEYSKIAMREMKEIFSGQKPFFRMEYPCQVKNDVQWFNLRIMNFDHKNEMIVVAHENITNMKVAQQGLDDMVLKLEERVDQRTKELREINSTFTDSISYAKRIQLGVLTSPLQLKEIFKKSFLLSEPCNIVSGDFFWCVERNGLKYVIVADCTGHGVPGALMSIVGNTLLNKIIKQSERPKDPAKILYKLDKELLKALPGDDERKVMDGMDIAISIINTSDKTIHFAGALRPLFILDTDGSVLEIEGNRSSIGRGMELEAKLFETKKLTYTSGQTMYLTSDGYYSQFGGMKGKKMMKTAFKAILQSLVEVPIEKQKDYLNDAFKKWQGDESQVDDVLVIGIELE